MHVENRLQQRVKIDSESLNVCHLTTKLCITKNFYKISKTEETQNSVDTVITKPPKIIQALARGSKMSSLLKSTYNKFLILRWFHSLLEYSINELLLCQFSKISNQVELLTNSQTFFFLLFTTIKAEIFVWESWSSISLGFFENWQT